jgi:RHS repeat-associated protein
MKMIDNKTWGGTTSVSSYSYTYDVQLAAEYTPSYSYDKIGNRKTSTGIESVTYTANTLNQYAGIQVSSLSSQPFYDLDGNLTGDGGNWTYNWNNENRLASATDGSRTIHFTYDYQGRLVKKDDGTEVKIYVYDGWNRIATFDSQVSTLSLQVSYLWGLDLSGTMQGAGGVGGLLKAGSLYPTYDANGNIMQKLDGNGVTVMNVAYDPFGNIISGTLVGEYGFSTKPFVEGPDWYYYGFRYYDPVTGRWPSRDPIGEQGGLNLYGFVANDAITGWDLLGQKEPCSKYSKTRVEGGVKQGRTTIQLGTPTSNGCGGSGASWQPPQGMFSVDFTPACNTHDECYGTCAEKKSSCDWNLRQDIRAECDATLGRFNFIDKAGCYAAAHSYYLGVRYGGHPFYEQGQDDHCKWEACCD